MASGRQPRAQESSARRARASARLARGRLARLRQIDLPREKALGSGIATLDDSELLALLLRTGLPDEDVLSFSARLLLEYDGLTGLARCDLATLVAIRGLGPAKAGEIAAAIEIARRIARVAARRERPLLRTPEQVAEHLALAMAVLAHEELWCLPLDARQRLIGGPRVASAGDVDGTDAGPRAFFRLALGAGASSCIAVHNHPTGDPAPSLSDRRATMRLVAAGRTLDLALDDHIILGAGGSFVSLRRVHPECFC
jgi:DNA repair protein RadC